MKRKNFFTTLPQNIFSGFVVSLIALPLGLGLAIASEAPPIAGIIAAVVGGIVVAIFGGSNLTIAGPGNGLVIVLLGAITTLGGGDLYQGYLYTLAAIIFSGGFMFLFGLFRMGILSNFFPSSALQGMLAAIGVGILSKQFFIMLGLENINGNTIELLLKIPYGLSLAFQNFSSNFLPLTIGLISLFFMLFHSKISNRFFHLIPAPMWIVLLAVLLSYYYEFILRTEYPIAESFLIKLPENGLLNLPHPNFSKIFSYNFIIVVFSITLISSIESLLSIKSVDKLDTEKRKSNINRDLKALGIATIISGFLGGLNVVTVIARSSVNVNNGGTNRSANFFHGVFLLVFIILFQEQIQRIALPALAAILVFTGYKLATPENILKIHKIGKEQTLIYFLTLFSTLLTDLIIGITIGVFTTLLIHIVVNKSIFLFSRNWNKPNVLMFKESETENYYVSVKNFCNFLNFYKLKKRIDQIPQNKNAVIDFSLCDFVDHTVMEEINDYHRSFERKKGVFEVIGLDVHFSESQHPFAIRKTRLQEKSFNVSKALTRRQKGLKSFAQSLNWKYQPEITTRQIKEIENFLFFKTKLIEYKYNQISNRSKDIVFFDLSFSEGAFIAKDNMKASFLLLKFKNNLPAFVLDRDFFLSGIYREHKWAEIQLKNAPDFSKHFFLQGENKKQTLTFFDKKLTFFFESQPYYHIESNGKMLLIKQKNRIATTQEIKRTIGFAKTLKEIIDKKLI